MKKIILTLLFIISAAILSSPHSADAATQRIRYVNTASTAGGNGTTNGTAGATRAYATLGAALGAEVGNLVTQDVFLTVYVSGSSADTGNDGNYAYNFSGWTTDATRYIEILPFDSTQRAGTVWDTGRYRVSVNTFFGVLGNTNTTALYLTIDGIQMEQTHSGAGQRDNVFLQDSNTTIPKVTIKNCFLRKTTTGNSAPWSNIFIGAMAAGGEFYAINNISQGNANGITVATSDATGSAKVVVYNNTIYGAVSDGLNIQRSSVSGWSGDIYVKNNLVTNSGGSDYSASGSGGTLTTATNATEDATSPNSLGSRTFTFVNAGTDFAITSADTGARGQATDLSADATFPFSTDIKGTVRAAPWDLGAFQVIAAVLSGTVTSPTTEANIRAGGKTIVLTLLSDTWVTTGATFDAQRQNIINGLTASSSPTFGWNNEVKAKIPVTDVVQTSPTVVTITLSAETGYNISSAETITATVPATALTSGNALIATPTFSVTPFGDAIITHGAGGNLVITHGSGGNLVITRE